MKRTWAAFAALIATGMLIAGCTTTASNQAPKAKFFVDKSVWFVGGTADFNASQSKDPDGKVKSYTWNFGDSSGDQTVTAKETTHTFSIAGAFNVSLVVKDDKGAKSKAVSAKVVVAPLPTANLSVTDTATSINFSVDTSNLGGLVTDYAWDFGDGGNIVKGASLSHAYTKMGNYTIALTITYNGQIASSTLNVKVQDRPPVANITLLTTAPYYSNKPISLTGIWSGDPDGSITSWFWMFNDSTTDNGANITHTFLKPGSYSAKLTVTDNNNNTGVATLNLEVLKDMIITNVTVQTFVDATNHTRANLSIKIQNLGDAKGPGTIRVNVTSYKADKSVVIDMNSTMNGGTWEPNTPDNSISVGQLLTDGFDPDGTWYLVEAFFQNNVIDSGWYQK